MGLTIGLGGGNAGGGGSLVVAGGMIQDMDGVTWTGTAQITDTTITEFPGADFRYVKTLEKLFYKLKMLSSVGKLKNTGNATSALSMFYNCSALQTVPLFDTAKVTNMNSMFNGCVALQSVPAFDTANVTNTCYMFSGCSKLQSVGGINMINVTVDGLAGNMFTNCTALVTANISNLCVSFDLSYCKILSIESVLFLFNNAKSGVRGMTIQLNSLVFDQLTEDQIAIATEKGFSVTSVVRK